MKRKKISASLGVGSSSLLMIFIVLCLVVFAVLSLVSASADNRLSQKLAERTAAYYDACNTAEDILMEIDEQLAACAAEAGDEASYLALCRDTLANMGTWTDGTPPVLNYLVAVSEVHNLSVSLEILYPTAEHAERYRITGWVSEFSDQWEAERSMNLATLPEEEP